MTCQSPKTLKQHSSEFPLESSSKELHPPPKKTKKQNKKNKVKLKAYFLSKTFSTTSNQMCFMYKLLTQ